MFLRGCLLLSVFLGWISSAGAQGRPPRRYGGQNIGPRVEPVSIAGLLKMKKPGLLLIATENQGDLLIGVNPKTRVSYTGEAKPAFLRPGMYIAFKATVDPKGDTTEKIEALSVFTPSLDKPVGLFPENGGAEPEQSKKAPKKTTESLRYEVRGKLMSYNPRDGRILVHALRGLVHGQLADDLKIPVEINDASFFAFAAAGDKVAAEVVPITRTRGQALALKIEAAKTLGEVEQKLPPKPGDRNKPVRGSKSPKTAPEKELPAPEKGLPAPAEDK
jgi:hypothetical protein